MIRRKLTEQRRIPVAGKTTRLSVAVHRPVVEITSEIIIEVSGCPVVDEITTGQANGDTLTLTYPESSFTSRETGGVFGGNAEVSGGALHLSGTDIVIDPD